MTDLAADFNSSTANGETTNDKQIQEKFLIGGIVTYADMKASLERLDEKNDADAYKKVKDRLDVMEKLILKIEKDPSNRAAILAFGSDPMKMLETMAKKSIEEQQTLGSSLNILSASQSEFSRRLEAEGGLVAVRQMVREQAEAVGAAVEDKARSFLTFFTGLFKKKEEVDPNSDEAFIARMEVTIPGLKKEMDVAFADLEDAAKDADKMISGAKKFNENRIKVMQQLAIYCGLTVEIESRYLTKYIPEAQATAGKTGMSEDYAKAQDVSKSMVTFMRHMRELHTILVQARSSVVSMGDTISNMLDQKDIMVENTTLTRAVWTSFLDQAGFTGSLLKLTGINRAASELTNRSLDSVSEMNATASEMNRKAMAEGAIFNVQKVLAASDEIVNASKKMAEAIRENYEGTRRQIAGIQEFDEQTIKSIKGVEELKTMGASESFAAASAANDDTLVVEPEAGKKPRGKKATPAGPANK